MKTPITILAQLIKDGEKIAKSTLTSARTRNDLLQTVFSYKEQVESESFNTERTCEGISDIYNEINHAYELQPELEQIEKLIREHLEEAKQFVLETTRSFNYKKKGKSQIIGIIELE